MRIELLGEEAAETLDQQDCGRVVAASRHAVYLDFSGGLVALVGRTAEPGPIHAHVDALPRVAVGDRIRIGIGDAIWHAPALPGGPIMSAVGDTVRQVLDHSPDLDLSGGAGPAREDRLASTMRAGGLPAVVAALSGRGSGLTPAGDDILAGLFLVSRAVSGPGGESMLEALAQRAATHAISRAYLCSAARGRSFAAVHELFAAGACGRTDLAGLVRDRLARIRHSSGLDLAYGILVGSTHWPDVALPRRS